MIEDAVDRPGLCDEGDYTHCLAAAGTFQRLNLEDAAQQFAAAGSNPLPPTPTPDPGTLSPSTPELEELYYEFARAVLENSVKALERLLHLNR